MFLRNARLRQERGLSPLPNELAWIASEPERDDSLQMLIEAWADLSTERPIGMAAGAIPWTAMRDWSAWHQLDVYASRLLIGAIRYVDAELAEARASRQRLDNATKPRS